MQIWKLLTHFGHGNLPASELAGLLSECGYKGDQLKAILEKAETKQKTPINDLKNHKSIIVRTAAKTMEKRQGLRVLAPESTNGICLASCIACTCCTGFFSSMGSPPLPFIARSPSSFSPLRVHR